jgi:hypothetical protein
LELDTVDAGPALELTSKGVVKCDAEDDAPGNVDSAGTVAADPAAVAVTEVLRLQSEDDNDIDLLEAGARARRVGCGCDSVRVTAAVGGMARVGATVEVMAEAEIGSARGTVGRVGPWCDDDGATGAVVDAFTGTTESRGNLGPPAVTDNDGTGAGVGAASKDKRELEYEVLVGATIDSMVGAGGSNETMLLEAVEGSTGATASGRPTVAKGESATCTE